MEEDVTEELLKLTTKHQKVSKDDIILDTPVAIDKKELDKVVDAINIALAEKTVPDHISHLAIFAHFILINNEVITVTRYSHDS